MARAKRFRHFPLIYICQDRVWGNPTVGNSRLPVFKVWEMVTNKCMDDLLEEEPNLTLGEINSVLEFVDWCVELGLMEHTKGRLRYDKDALFRSASLDCPPKGSLCIYCCGFIPTSSRASVKLREIRRGSEEPVAEGIAHGHCVEAHLLDEPLPEPNVLK